MEKRITLYNENGPQDFTLDQLQMTEKVFLGIYWRGIRDRIGINIAFHIPVGTIEYENAKKRVKWINEHRL